MDITSRTVFIPGATSGIGLSLALALSEAGSTVVIGGRRESLLADILREHPALDGVVIDTTDADSIASAASTVLARHPQLDTVVAMAGIMVAEDWHSAEGFVATSERIVTTNVLGPVRLIGAFIEHLQTQQDAAIVTVSSGLAFAPLAVTPSYNASKAFIHMLSESIRLQLADTSVSIVELEPPSVQTDLMPGHAADPMAMPLDEYIAETVGLLAQQPTPAEIQVERVKFLRYGEARGDYPQVVAALNGVGHDAE